MSMLSQTEERLRTFVEHLTSSLTEETDIVVMPADCWAAVPDNKPPLLMYRVADVAVIGNKILAVTGHEIGHLLYTTPYKYKFDVSKKPKAAHQLLNVVEDARIERAFAKKYPGAETLFVELHGDGSDDSDMPFTETMRSKFGELPAKWRFIFNIDRHLHGEELLGSDTDKDAVRDIAEHIEKAADAPDTQAAADCLEPVYKKLLDLFMQYAHELKQKREEQEKLKEALDKATADAIRRLQNPRPDVVDTGAFDDDQDEDVAQALKEHEAAEQDDGKPGGTDGSPGMRKEGVGEGTEGSPGAEGEDGESGDDSLSGEEQGDPTGSKLGSGTTSGGNTEGSNQIAGEGNPDIDYGEEEDDIPDAERVKPINIFEEMLAEEATSNNRMIKQMQKRQIERAKAAKSVDQKIMQEQKDISDDLADVFGKESGSEAIRNTLEENGRKYATDKATLHREIRALRAYARSVLQDNSRERYGGSYESGRHIKKTRLYRPLLDDFRVFERKEMVGGKSYSVALVVDQSGSMMSYSGNNKTKQMLAYEAALVFLEAFDGIADTSLIGFTEFPQSMVSSGRRRRQRYYGYGYRASQSRTYKGLDQNLKQRQFTVPMIAGSYGATPMGAGLKTAIAQLKKAETEVRAIVLITDGYPTDGNVAEQQAQEAFRQGIVLYSLHVGDYLSADSNAVNFLSKISERTQSIGNSSEIPEAVYGMLRGIVKRGGGPVTRT